jgi:hypothetical protein
MIHIDISNIGGNQKLAPRDIIAPSIIKRGINWSVI